MNRKKGIRILLTVLTVAALLAAGGYALWKNGFFEKINSVEALREVIAGTGMWAGGVYFALQMMTVIIAPIPSNISMMAGALALGFWPAMILGVLAVGVGSVIVFLAARALGKKAVQRFLDKGVMDKYILTQSKISSNRVKALVVGIGLNTSQEVFHSEIQDIATSIKKEFSITINSEEFITAFCKKFEEKIIERIEN